MRVLGLLKRDTNNVTMPPEDSTRADLVPQFTAGGLFFFFFLSLFFSPFCFSPLETGPVPFDLVLMEREKGRGKGGKRKKKDSPVEQPTRDGEEPGWY